jgi:hypothetical protein
MSFAEIEAVVGAPLPLSARRHRGWWSNNPGNSGATRAWLDAGYRTAEVDMAGERLVFRRQTPGRTRPPEATAHAPQPGARLPAETEAMTEPASTLHEAALSYGQAAHRVAPPSDAPHALFGRLQAAVRVLAGVDVTAPADAGWGQDGDPAGRAG